MHHEMLTQHALLPSRQYKSRHTESAFRDACHTSSGPCPLVVFRSYLGSCPIVPMGGPANGASLLWSPSSRVLAIMHVYRWAFVHSYHAVFARLIQAS